MSSQWYFARGGKKHGPVSTDQLKEMARSGLLQPTDMVMADGTGKWGTAGSVQGLFEIPVATAIAEFPGVPAASMVQEPQPIIAAQQPSKFHLLRESLIKRPVLWIAGLVAGLAAAIALLIIAIAIDAVLMLTTHSTAVFQTVDPIADEDAEVIGKAHDYISVTAGELYKAYQENEVSDCPIRGFKLLRDSETPVGLPSDTAG